MRVPHVNIARLCPSQSILDALLAGSLPELINLDLRENKLDPSALLAIDAVVKVTLWTNRARPR